jgi:hypothetical protein
MPMIRSGFILLLVLLAGLSCSKKNQMIEPVLKELDETIDNRQLFENEKQESIARLKRDLLETRDAHKRTEIYCSLFDEYKNYQYDSAFVYAKLIEKSALQESGEVEYRAKAQVALLHCFKSVGFFNEAVDVIRAFDPKGVPAPICAEFYSLGAATWQNLSSFVSGTEALASKYDEEKLACYDKVLEYAAPDSYLYGYANLDKMLIENYSDSLAISARDAFIVTNDWDDHQKAVQYSILSEAYNKVRRFDEAVYYRALSAILDIRSCTHETTSVKVLAGHMYARGNIDRAYKYIQQAQYDAEFYNSRLRKAEINTILPVIESSRYNWLNNQRLLLFIILFAIVALLIITASLLLVLRSRNKVLRQMHADLAEKTALLEQSNLSLTDAISKLREANEIKDQYIVQSLYGNTAFVNEVNEAVNEAVREITLKRPDEARTTLYHIGIKKERARIAASFDTAFLKLFPNWLDEFNALFPKDQQIRLADDGTMPMDVRIFALMRLGLDNAAEVAEYLNLSVDTVYVYKARLKAKALVGKDEFDSRIMAIPKP